METLKHTEIGILLYPRCTMASVHGLTDAFQVANDYADQHGSGERIRTSHWKVSDGGFARSHDSAPEVASNPEITIIPGRLAHPLRYDEVEAFVGWLRERHGSGATIASICGGRSCWDTPACCPAADATPTGFMPT